MTIPRTLAWSRGSTVVILGLILVLLARLPAAGQEAGEVIQDCEACPIVIVVPAGTFLMGSPESETARSGEGGPGSERPQHEVTIAAAFAVGRYEVAFAEWDACVEAGGCGGYLPSDEGWGRGWRPVINVNWHDAKAYVEWLSEHTGESYRLLSESEWEYVARAGSETRWHWGDVPSDQCRHANGRDLDAAAGLPPSPNPNSRSTMCRDGYVYTAPLGTYEANGFGVYDLLGNVFEWTEDCFRPAPLEIVERLPPGTPEPSAAPFNAYDGAPDDGSAWTDGPCEARVWRGGSWGSTQVNLRSAARFFAESVTRRSNAGFRVARDVR